MMTAPTSDGEYLRDANAQREHEAELARIDSDKAWRLARLANERAFERRIWLGWFLGGLAVVAIIGALISWGAWNTSEDKRLRQQQIEKQAQVAQECIREGNIYVNGNCLITRKG